MAPAPSLGDIFGYLALLLIVASAVLMFSRSSILKKFRNLDILRQVHIAVSSAAGLFLILHVASFVDFPQSSGVYIGYASFVLIFVVWLTGTAFLERLRDSLLFHGSLSIAAIALALIHASVTAIMPVFLSVAILASSASVAFANAAFHIHKMK